MREGAPTELRGAATVARNALAASGRAPFARVALVNGAPGVIVAPRGRLIIALDFTVRNGRIVAIDVVADSARLRQLELGVLDA